MSVLNNELLFEQIREEVIEEATETETLCMMDDNDIYLATMNRFASMSAW